MSFLRGGGFLLPQNWPELVQHFARALVVVISTLDCGVAIGIPTCVLLTPKKKSVRSPILESLNVMQTITRPGALVLIPLPFIGASVRGRRSVA